jgi:hypothetical protein
VKMDRYGNKLKHAQWTWREEKVCNFHNGPRNKDRAMGRRDKRAARQEDRLEIARDKEEG